MGNSVNGRGYRQEKIVLQERTIPEGYRNFIRQSFKVNFYAGSFLKENKKNGERKFKSLIIAVEG